MYMFSEIYIMGNVDENRRHIVNLLDSDEYVIDDAEGLILASKYCKGSDGRVTCFLVEAASPFEHLRAWGGVELPQSSAEVDRIVAELNEKLILMLSR
jgi:hypothetical protein